MSHQSGNNRSQQRPSHHPQYRDADELVRSILDDRPATATISPSGELLRAVERFHRNIDRVLVANAANAVNAANAANAASAAVVAMSQERELRRRFNRDPEPPSESDGSRSSNPNPPGLPPLRSLHRISMTTSGGPGRSRPYQRERNLERYRTSMENRSGSFNSDSLVEANSNLRALLDLTNPTISQPAMSPPLSTNDHPEEARHPKRRKLDSDKIASSYKPIRYGIYGQQEPGQLTMEIVSCDGGQYPYSDGSDYTAENILKNDNSVYCTKGNRCNIVLRHQGGTTFSLKELVIKAPPPMSAPGSITFSSPVREGLVFVSMDQDELWKRTAQYQIQYLSSRTNPPASLPAIYSMRYDDDVPRIRPRGGYPSDNHDDDDQDYQMAQIPSEFTVSPPPFNITTECSEDHSGDEGGRQPSFLRSQRRTPNRIGALPFESDNDDDGDPWGQSASEWSDLSRLRSAWQFNESDSLEEAREASQLATQEAVRAVGGELMAPLTRFHIEKDKNKCSISFDPPVSGRFILLKFWSPQFGASANIDIQAVIAKGFSGPRYFPSVQTM